MDEHRKFQRISKEVNLTVKPLQYPLNQASSEPAVTKNIACRGVCFASIAPYEAGTLLNLKIDLRGWQHYLKTVFSIVDTATFAKPLTAIAEVSWCKQLAGDQGYEIGARFKDIYEDDLAAFEKYMDTRILET